MITTKGYAAQHEESGLAPWDFQRRELGAHDVQFDITYCGVCHSDIHQVRGEWGNSMYPMVPGHEIVGRVVAVGAEVRKFTVGDLAGTGCLVDSCRACDNCQRGLEQYCINGNSQTYNGLEQDKKTPTYGGYSNTIVVHEDFVLHISDKLDLAATAPLLCAGITTYSPLRHWGLAKGHKLAVVGLGGLGHMGVKFGVAFGAEVTVLSTSPAKEADARKLGAHKFVVTSDPAQLESVAGYYDFILDTVSAEHDYNVYLSLLKTDGVHICVGAPPTPSALRAFSLIPGRKSIAGSSIGGLPETQEMLDFCAEHNIVSDIELIPIQDVEKAYERMLKGDVRYRFVIDMATL
ncbi:NAD(P)-dependent alcohol dehydrogenase [Spirosoma utsteinense]|uniref:Zinc-type alcohol dehydrogenase-like protein n=1 Tax=Spirosoma utsteinense TaxID=2585773 RepID=A0ABR6WAP8_9BACT|nr:NAD(P)-dependent alcohol dehydrogenase [Spirosoma utsteinense]MBC3787316.1 putative zinc-type alcohol dehydrogenase-like protein [Spirosoma utsteinense]MBC3793001.1 putative zinc-type alcohol dehydrogenase-like protein [Spirosoma utsteinense]